MKSWRIGGVAAALLLCSCTGAPDSNPDLLSDFPNPASAASEEAVIVAHDANTHAVAEPDTTGPAEHVGGTSADSSATEGNVVLEVAWAHKAEADEWTGYVLSALDEIGAPLLAAHPRDIGAFCPAYSDLDVTGRRAFWTSLISSIARYESNFDPRVSFDEKANCPSCDWATTRDGRNVVSRGLLQISQESANAYSGCSVPIADELTLHEAALNLRCGVAILSRLVSRDEVVSERTNRWQGGAAYWAVLRPGKLEAIQDFTAQTNVCRG